MSLSANAYVNRKPKTVSCNALRVRGSHKINTQNHHPSAWQVNLINKVQKQRKHKSIGRTPADKVRALLREVSAAEPDRRSEEHFLSPNRNTDHPTRE